jgi:hypothetical protein
MEPVILTKIQARKIILHAAGLTGAENHHHAIATLCK